MAQRPLLGVLLAHLCDTRMGPAWWLLLKQGRCKCAFITQPGAHGIRQRCHLGPFATQLPRFVSQGCVCVCVYVRLHTRRVTGRSCLLPPAPWLQPHGRLQEPAEFTPYTEHTWVSVSRQVQNGAWHWGGTAGWCPVPPQQQAGSSHTSALSSSQALRFVAGPHQTSPRFFHP